MMASPLLSKRPVKTALHQAVIDGRLKQVRLLVGSKYHAGIDVKDIHGRTPLMLACLLENELVGWKMVKILLSAGVNCNVTDKLGRSALSYVCLKGYDTILKKLLKEDIMDFNSPDNDGNPPINLAAMSGNPAVVKLLIDVLHRFGLSVDYRNLLGYTALLLATKYGHYVSAHLLVTQGGASPMLRDNEMFLNAAEWASRSHILQAQLVKAKSNMTFHQRHKSAPAMSFSRESTLYDGPNTAREYTCQHVKTRPDPFGSYFHLPTIFRTQGVETPLHNEAFVGNADARKSLLDAIDEITKTRPTSAASSNVSRISHPSSVKLMALSPRSRAVKMVSDLELLFKIYSDQYPEMLRRQKTERSASVKSEAPVHVHAPVNTKLLSVKKPPSSPRKSIVAAN